MDKRFLCVFDLDGTFYPKESNITFEMRNRVISYIAQILDISYHEAELRYRELPKTFPNPYDGLKSLGILGIEYQKIFDSIDVNNYMRLDPTLRDKLCRLSLIADICVVSFAPNNYVSRMITALGVSSYIKNVYSVNENTNYSKKPIFEYLMKEYNYEKYYAIGDDVLNDLVPAKEIGFKTYLVDFDNVPTNIYSILNSVTGDLLNASIPRVMRIENNAVCNEKCIICPYDNLKRNKGVMSDELFKKLVVEHSSLVKNPKLIFPASIGEPFLDKYFFDKLSFANKYYTEIAAFTNATMLTEEAFRKFVYHGGTELMLTLHGFTEEMYAYITQTTFYKKVRMNIEKIALINSKLSKPITLYLDIYADDSEECELFIEKMKLMGVRAQRFNLEDTHNWRGNIDIYSNKEMKKRCGRIYEQFGVQYNGNVVPCCVDVEGDYLLGNVNEKTLKEIFTSLEYVYLINMERQGEIHRIPFCSLCNI